MPFGFRVWFTLILGISIFVSPLVAEAKVAHSQKKHVKKKAHAKKSKRHVSKKKKRKHRVSKKHRVKRAPKAPVVVQSAPKPSPPKNAYSASPDEGTSLMPAAGAIPLHAPGEKQEERRVRLDMTKPYGKRKPTAVDGPARGIATEKKPE